MLQVLFFEMAPIHLKYFLRTLSLYYIIYLFINKCLNIDTHVIFLTAIDTHVFFINGSVFELFWSKYFSMVRDYRWLRSAFNL